MPADNLDAVENGSVPAARNTLAVVTAVYELAHVLAQPTQAGDA